MRRQARCNLVPARPALTSSSRLAGVGGLVLLQRKAIVKPKRPPGRQSSYTPEIAALICQRLANGESLREICKTQGMPPASTVRQWAIDVPAFVAQYARARDLGLDHEQERLMEVAQDKERDPQCRRVEIDTIKWRLSKLAPKRYGDRLELEVSGELSLTEIARQRLAKLNAESKESKATS